MAPTVSLLSWHRAVEPAWPLGEACVIASLAEAADALDRAAGDWVLLWDPASLGAPDADLIGSLIGEARDVWHAGLVRGAAGQPAELDLVRPTWYFTPDPPADARAVSWRLTLDALLVRVDVVRALGGIDRAFRTSEAAGLDMGWRYVASGAVPMHEPALATSTAPPFTLDPVDRYVLLGRHVGLKWLRYVAARRGLVRELRPLREAQRRLALASAPRARAHGVYVRPALSAPRRPVGRDVSVILPTLGRYDMVAKVLDDLRAQTAPAAEIICVDQTSPHDPSVFEPFTDLPLTVVHQTELGQWRSRNEAVARSRHDLLLFLDDDSRVPAEFIEEHLACLDAHDADISAGASLSVVGAPVPENYGFYRVADQFDSGNALVRRDLLKRVGAFDRHFDRMRAGDAEFGLRAQMAGAVSIHNPKAYRDHFKAAEGGLRSFGSWDSFRQRGLFSPLPLPSVVYFAMRYFSRRQVREDLVIGLAAGLVPYELKRRASLRVWLTQGLLFALTAPLQAVRVWRSVRRARQMVAEGPRIPAVD